jgi:hypothetical protein
MAKGLTLGYANRMVSNLSRLSERGEGYVTEAVAPRIGFYWRVSTVLDKNRENKRLSKATRRAAARNYRILEGFLGGLNG